MATSPRVRTRFAPSPTGFLHIGGLRTALFNYLFAKKFGGEFLLRIEDTDQARLVPGSQEQIVDALHWTGLHYDEGPDIGGPHAPYVQSQRLPLYQEAAETLVAKGFAYPCFCSPERLTTLREAQAAHHQPPRYDGHCRSLEATEASRRRAAGESCVIRAKLPQTGSVVVHDLIRGDVSFSYDTIDDAVLLKSDGYPTYHLSVVIDDHAMEISHVLRAEEWLPSTPKHLFLYEAFAWEPPIFAHVPILLSPKGGKLSKRDGAVSALEYRDEGYLPEALVNFLALLGWNPGDDREHFTLEELVKSFSLEHVQKSGAVFDQKKLDHMNGLYIRALTPETLLERAGDWASNLRQTFGERAMAAVRLVQDRLVTLKDLQTHAAFLVALPDYDAKILIPKKGSAEQTAHIVGAIIEWCGAVEPAAFTSSTLHDALMKQIQASGWTNALALWPMRVALSGQMQSPGVFEIAEVLQKEETLRRLGVARAKLA